MAEAKTNKDDRVELFVPKGTARDDPNVYLSVNGEIFLLPRGQTSMVPPYVKAQYERSCMAETYQERRSDALIEKTKRPTNA